MSDQPTSKVIPISSRQRRKGGKAPSRTPVATPDLPSLSEPLAAAMPVRLRPGSRSDRNVQSIFAEGNRCLLQRNFAAAAQRYRRALQLGGHLAEAYNSLAVACHRQGFFAEARRAIEQALQLDPRSPLYFRNAALISRDADEPFRALEYFGQALLHSPGSAALLQGRGVLYHSLGRFPEALADLAKALELDSGLPGLVCQLAVAATSAGDAPRARHLLDQLTASRPQDPEPWFNLGIISSQMGDEDSARRYLERARELAPASPRITFQLASLYARRREDGDNRRRAVELLSRCVEANRGRETEVGRALAQVHFLLASLHDDTPAGYQQAVQSYRAGLEWDPDFAVAHNNLGALCLAGGSPAQALEHFVRALELRPTYSKACLNFAKTLYHHGTQVELEQALEALLRATGRQASSTLAVVCERLVDLAEHEVYEEIHERDHKIKNLLAMTGTRLKRTRSALTGTPQAGELDEVVEVLRQTHDQMQAYLAAIRPGAGPTEQVDLNLAVRRVAAELSRSRPAEVEVAVELASSMPEVAGDSARFEEAILNLAKNALEAVGERGRVRLSTSWDPRAGFAAVAVEDNGRGISPEQQTQIFRSGYTTKPSGNGLGLSIVRRTVADYQGALELVSRPGRSTRFTMKFPIDAEPLAQPGGLSMGEPLREDPSDLIVSELA
ncbi:MAG: tetratricopeptide repeat protein [Candidatus Riflebacteria bacterium]|nr:tetratricopeptide repeat protein [Candidatus Riflebacteria bacterium]